MDNLWQFTFKKTIANVEICYNFVFYCYLHLPKVILLRIFHQQSLFQHCRFGKCKCLT